MKRRHKKSFKRPQKTEAIPIVSSENAAVAKSEPVGNTSSATIFLSIAALIVSLISAANSIYQTVQTRKIQQGHVWPDVQCVVRHCILPQYKDTRYAAELAVWNNGPIKAISVAAIYKSFVVRPTDSEVIASIKIGEDLLEPTLLLPELGVGDRKAKAILGTEPMAIFLVDLSYYRETDMEKFTRRELFLYDSGTFYEHNSFKSRTDYSVLMDSLQRKMRAEELYPQTNFATRASPAPSGSRLVYWNFATIGKDGRWVDNTGSNQVVFTPIDQQ